MAAERTRPLFLAPHYDDVALSCGGTVAALADQGERPLIITVFGGPPDGELSDFAAFQHRRWDIQPAEGIATRREEEEQAAQILGAEATWLEIPDAIYRGERYMSDDDLFGAVHPEEIDMPHTLEGALRELLRQRELVPARVYVPLAVGNHVDHQHVFQLGRRLVEAGADVSAYEDFPYAGEPAGRGAIGQRASELRLVKPDSVTLTEGQLQRRIDAVLCYRSQVPVIFRHQGDPAEAIRRYVVSGGDGERIERFWPLNS